MTALKPTGGFKALRFAGLVALAALGLAVFLIVGTYFFWQAEKKSGALSQRNLQDLRIRLEKLKRDREELRGSEETYKQLVARGAFAPEYRLDLIEAFEQLKKRHQLVGLEYEVFPQRPLKFATGANYGAVNVNASRIRLKIQAYHDGDLLAFLDEFPRIQRGFFPLDKCVIKRVADTAQQAPVASGQTGQLPVDTSAILASAAVEAECTMEWITLDDKTNPVDRQASAVVRKPL